MKNIFLIVLAVLCVFLFFKWRTTDSTNMPEKQTITLVDTFYTPTKYDTIKISVPTLVSSKTGEVPKEKIASSNCDSLNHQYDDLLNEMYSVNKFSDTILRDSLKILATHEVYGNKLISSDYQFFGKDKIIQITNNTTIIQRKRQVFIGGGAETDFQFNSIKLNVGAQYKDKKDNVIQFTFSADNIQNKYFGVSFYKLISLKRNK
jgi:hypothetical protein